MSDFIVCLIGFALLGEVFWPRLFDNCILGKRNVGGGLPFSVWRVLPVGRDTERRLAVTFLTREVTHSGFGFIRWIYLGLDWCEVLVDSKRD